MLEKYKEISNPEGFWSRELVTRKHSGVALQKDTQSRAKENQQCETFEGEQFPQRPTALLPWMIYRRKRGKTSWENHKS